MNANAFANIVRFVRRDRSRAETEAARMDHTIRTLNRAAVDYADQCVAAYKSGEQNAGALWQILSAAAESERSEIFRRWDLLTLALFQTK